MSEEIKSKIAKLDAAIKSPATPANMLGKLKETKASLEKELDSSKSATKKTTKILDKLKQKVKKVVKPAKAAAPKKVVEHKVKKTSSAAIDRARKIAEKYRKKKGISSSKSNLERDAKRKALPMGKRTSAEGNVYYENRPNRSDVSTKRKPYLEMGGEVESESHFKYYKVPNEQLWAIQECNKDFADDFGGECIVIRHKRSEEDAIKEVERLNGLGYCDYEKGGELSESEKERLAHLQSKEDTDSLNKSENEEYEMLVEKYRKTNDYKGYGKGGTIKDIDLPNSNLYLYGFGRDTNGNSTIKISIGANRPFSIQINNPEFYKKTYDKRGYKLSELSEEDILGIEQEVVDYIQENGSKEQKLKLKTYSSFAIGGKLSNKRAYQNEPENKETYTRYADSLEGERAKPAGWRYTDAGAKRLKIKNPNVLVSKAHLEKYRGKYFTDSKGVKHRYVYIERRADKSDIKRGFPYLERGGELIDVSNLQDWELQNKLNTLIKEKEIGNYDENSNLLAVSIMYEINKRQGEYLSNHLESKYDKGGSIPNNEYKRFYELSKSKEGYTKEYEDLEKKINTMPDVEYALHHFKNADDFADYIVNKRTKGEILYPREKAWKTDAEMNDERSYHKTFKSGGSIPNNYEGKTAEQVWNSWTWEQKYHFIKDHDTKPSMRPHFTKANDYSDIAASDFNEIPIGVQNTVATHINEGQYEEGGTIEEDIFLRFMTAQIEYVVSLKTITEKKKVIDVLINNMSDYVGDEMSKRITLDNLKYAKSLKTTSEINNALKISLNALKH